MDNTYRYLEKVITILMHKQQETDENVELLKKNLARVMVQTTKELDTLNAKKGE